MPMVKTQGLVSTFAAVFLAAGSLAVAGDLRLVDAARRQDLPALVALVKMRADAKAAQPDGATALHWAAHWGNSEAVTLLLQAGADANAANAYGVTPLLLASETGSALVVTRLLAGGATPDLPHTNGMTPLMSAARGGHLHAVEALLDRGASVNAAEQIRGQNALMWALAEGHTAVVETLLARGASVEARSASGFTPLMFAARTGSTANAKVLLSRGASLKATAADGATPLLVATVRGHTELAMFFLQQGADPNALSAGYTPLHWASGVWESIMTHDYHVEEGEWSALGGIPRRGDKLALIAALLDHGAEPNARMTKLAPRYGMSLFIGRFLNNATPFYIAALSGDGEVMRLLASRGANPTLTAAANMTPLIAAAGRTRIEGESSIPESAHLDAVRAALDLGNDVNAVNGDGWTALHAAAYCGFNSIVELLVSRGAQLNIRTRAGDTPLKIAEGYVFPNMINVKPATADLLKKLGGVSPGGPPTRVNENLASDGK